MKANNIVIILATFIGSLLIPSPVYAGGYTAASRAARLLQGPAASRADAITAAIAVFRPDTDAEAILAGYDVDATILGSTAVVRAASAELDALAEDPAVAAISLQRHLDSCNDLTAADLGVPPILSGTTAAAPGCPYTGRGVITAVFDSGFDIHNPAFADADGRCRIRRAFIYDDEGHCTVYNETMLQYLDTDDANHFHGSHVLGTMAGRAAGTPYGGMAPEADIVVAAGPLTDANIADGVARIAAYARSCGMPCVINLSLSDFIGPRDGTDPYARALAEATSATGDAILVVSAGNYRQNGDTLSVILDADDPALRTFVVPEAWRRQGEGNIGIWSGDHRDMDLTLVIMDTNTRQTLAEYPVPKDKTQPFVLATTDLSRDLGVPVTQSEIFDLSAQDSYVAVFYDDNTDTNGRPNYYITTELISRMPGNQTRRVALGLVIDGTTGQRIDLTMEDNQLLLCGLWIDGWSWGTNDFTISSMAATDGAVCVGAWAHRPDWTDADGGDVSLGIPVGSIAPWSSSGRLVDGTTLPHVAAPGAATVSVLSDPFLAAHPDTEHIMARYPADGRTNAYFMQWGTSMSSPAVAGTIALWLQADPTLTAADIHRIVAVTSRPAPADTIPEPTGPDTSRFTPGKPNIAWGAGYFDAAAGLAEVVRNASVAAPELADDDWSDSTLTEVFTPDGRCVARYRALDSTPELPHGVYIIRRGRNTSRIAI